MKDETLRYLNDHLAGSAGALHLVDQIAQGMPAGTDTRFFEDLKRSIGQDRRILERLIELLGAESSSASKVMGAIAGRIGWLKLAWEGLKPGKLGMFEALELLALGIHGKHLLWKALISVQDRFPHWDDLNFESLNRDAVRQRDAVEEFRLQAAARSLGPADEEHLNPVQP
jgi:hypothetical protein